MGILRDDPRLAPLIDSLKKLQKEDPTRIFSINNIWLDFVQFSQVVQSCKCLISDTLEGNIIIPEFEDFCDNITDIYNK